MRCRDVQGSASRSLRAKARNQLGTVGSGNHYVDVFADESGRDLGRRALRLARTSATPSRPASSRCRRASSGASARRNAKRCSISTTPIGDAYWQLMKLAGEYAYAGREWVARKVVSILGGHEQELVHNHHNFAWRETHGGEELVVVRKGATPAFPGQKGFVGGSMGDDAVIVRARPRRHARRQRSARCTRPCTAPAA